MSQAERTINSDRPDLAALPTKQREGYIGLQILPVTRVTESAGDSTAQGLPTDVAAVEDRTKGSDITATIIGNVPVTFACKRRESSRSIDEGDVPAMGGIEVADYVGGRQAKHENLKKLDGLIEALIYTGTPTDISSGLLAGIAAAADSIASYDGKITLVISKTSFRFFANSQEVLDRLALHGYMYANPGDVTAIRPNVIKDMLSQIYAVDDILIGADNVWQESDKYSAALVVRPVDDSAYFFKEQAVLGTTFQYFPDGVQPFEIYSFYDNRNTCNTYRATSFSDPKIINSGAMKYLKLGAKS